MAEIQKQTTSLSLVGNKDTLNELIKSPAFQDAIKTVANKYATPERVFKMAALAASRQPKLYSCTKPSFIQCLVKSAELGLDCGGATGQAYLVPFRNGMLSKKAGYDVYECTFIPGYQGLTEIVYRAKAVNYIDAQIVYTKDLFKYSLGTTPMIQFEPNLDGDRGDIKCAYAVIRLKGSELPKIEIMSREQLLDIKSRSKAADYGPWKTDEAEMMRKTVLRRALKYVPKTPQIEQALELDNQMYDFSVPAMEAVDELPEQGVKGIKAKIKDITPKGDIKQQIEQLKREGGIIPDVKIEESQVETTEDGDGLPDYDGPTE